MNHIAAPGECAHEREWRADGVTSCHLRIAIAHTDDRVVSSLRALLIRELHLDVVAVGSSRDDAIALMDAVSPDLVFIGIDLPDMDGLSALAAIPAARRPAAVVVAATRDHAFQAFELQAMDYLLLPLDRQRVERAVVRARQLHARGAMWPPIGRPRPIAPCDTLIIKSTDHLTFVRYDDVDWIESAGNYVRVHKGAEAYLMRESMRGIEARLDHRFLRINRGAIVNVSRIKHISMHEGSSPTVLLTDGRRIAAGRYIESRLREWLGGRS